VICCALLAATLARAGSGQVRVVSAPPDPSLLGITRGWARASSLGDLRESRAPADLVELRVWGGYGFGATQGIVLRRARGRWRALLAQVRRCAIQIPNAVGDTASRATMQGYVAEARKRCDTPLTDVGAGMRVITADMLAVDTLSIPDSTIDETWRDAVRAGVLRLPPNVARSAATSSDFTYVVELRQGGEYRASQIEHVDQPETGAARAVQAGSAALNAILPAVRRVTP
jgi:hypothetical protein